MNVLTAVSKETEQELEDFSPLMRLLLEKRGITTREEADAFLNPDWVLHTHDPFEMAGMEHAVERIVKAVDKNEKITIFTDYDTDGLPAGVVLHDFFKKIGHENFEVYVPHRVLEGFGLNSEAIDEFIENKTNLLITLDCGIQGNEEVKRAQDAGIDVIVTDHHLPGPELPPAYAVLNPKLETCNYPEPMLCGAGVGFKLVQALLSRMRDQGWLASRSLVGPKEAPGEGWEKWLLDMVGIATLSDMVPLVGENRTFAHYGLLVLRKSPRFGLKALLKKTRVNQKYLSEEDIGFSIGPRINAASRMGVPIDAFKLLTADNEHDAFELAEHLEAINNERKGVVAAITKAINKKLSKRTEQPAIIATGDPSWSPSLLGLAANSVVEHFKRPAFVWGRGDGKEIKGSCRSDGKAHLLELMQAVPSGFFLEFGGHREAGGFSVSHENVHRLEEMLVNAHENLVSKGYDAPSLEADAEIHLSDITWQLWDELQLLAPFGVGNPKPLFQINDLNVQSAEAFGKAKNHLKLKLSDISGYEIEAIEFFKTPESYGVKSGQTISLLAHLEKDTFGYKPKLRLRIIEIVK